MDSSGQKMQSFIAYKGNEINHESIIKALQRKFVPFYFVKSEVRDNVIFAKVGIIKDTGRIEPFYIKWPGAERTSLLTVGGYNYNK